jgi:sulfoxide reductase heme-binding subunit YedZ
MTLKYYKPLLTLILLIPFAVLVKDVVNNTLGPDPVAVVADYTGLWAIITLLITMTMSPLARALNKGWVLRARRQAGLVMFFYACLHLLTFFALEIAWQWSEVVRALTEQPYIILGMMAFILLLPLAITSTNKWVRRLGRKWKTLHQLVYIALPLVFIHGWLQLRADAAELLPYLLWMLLILIEQVVYRLNMLPYAMKRR